MSVFLAAGCLGCRLLHPPVCDWRNLDSPPVYEVVEPDEFRFSRRRELCSLFSILFLVVSGVSALEGCLLPACRFLGHDSFFVLLPLTPL